MEHPLNPMTPCIFCGISTNNANGVCGLCQEEDLLSRFLDDDEDSYRAEDYEDDYSEDSDANSVYSENSGLDHVIGKPNT